MTLMRRSSRSLNPSLFLWALKREIPDFKFHQQFDAQEILMPILNSVLSPTSISQDLVGCTLRIETSCKECFHSDASEDTNLFLSTPVCSSVKASVAKYLSVKSIVGEPCAVCCSTQGFERETFVVTCGEFQIVHLKRFDNNLKKLIDIVSCFPDT